MCITLTCDDEDYDNDDDDVVWHRMVVTSDTWNFTTG